MGATQNFVPDVAEVEWSAHLRVAVAGGAQAAGERSSSIKYS